MLSSRCATDDVPGIGSITGERRSSQASASCAGVAPCSARDRRERAAGLGQLAGGQREPRDERDALALAVVQHVLGAAVGQVVAGSARRRSAAISRAASICATLTSDSPMCRILPSSCSAPSSPSWSSSGTFGSMRCSWSRSMRSRPRWRRLSSTCWRRYSGRPDRPPLARALPGEPGLGRDDQVIGVRVQGLADQLLGDERAVRVGGVDERHAELDGAAQHPDRLVGVGRVAPDARAGQLHRAVTEPVDRQVAAERNVPDAFAGCSLMLVAIGHSPIVVLWGRGKAHPPPDGSSPGSRPEFRCRPTGRVDSSPQATSGGRLESAPCIARKLPVRPGRPCDAGRSRCLPGVRQREHPWRECRRSLRARHVRVHRDLSRRGRTGPAGEAVQRLQAEHAEHMQALQRSGIILVAGSVDGPAREPEPPTLRSGPHRQRRRRPQRAGGRPGGAGRALPGGRAHLPLPGRIPREFPLVKTES